MKRITLLSDFGTSDEYVGVMKGVISGIAPDALLIDLTHGIPPQDISAGALALGRAFPYFPPGTIHLAVVDPGVGTSRRPMAARLGEQFFVGPDNGLFTLVYRRALAGGQAVSLVHLDRPQYHLEKISASFHGRDIFAPAAAHLAAGVPLSELGSFFADPVLLDLPEPVRLPGGWHGAVVHVDAFGNLATNISREHLSGFTVTLVSIRGQQIPGLSTAYARRKPGQLAALIDSAGCLSIVEVNGSAARRLSAGVGERVEVSTSPAEEG